MTQGEAYYWFQYAMADRAACERLEALYAEHPELHRQDAELFQSGAAGIG